MTMTTKTLLIVKPARAHRQRSMLMAKVDDIRYIVFDTESVVEGASLSRVL